MAVMCGDGASGTVGFRLLAGCFPNSSMLPGCLKPCQVSSFSLTVMSLSMLPQVVSGTPGRVYDMIKRRSLRTRAIKLLVLVRCWR